MKLEKREAYAIDYVLELRDLKELSGAVLRKTAFSFRLAYILAIEDVLNIRLPIILDSPSGKKLILKIFVS